MKSSLCAALFSAALVLGESLRAETLMELDFQKYDESSRLLSVNTVRPGASDTLRVSDEGASIEPETETRIPSRNPSLQRGFGESMTVTGEGGGCFQTTGRELGNYAQYTGVKNGFGTGTIVLVFQPHFSGQLSGSSVRQRAFLFCTNHRGTAEEAVVLTIDKALVLYFGMGSAAFPARRVSLAQPDWDPTKWYFVAASWGPMEKPTLFWKEIDSPNANFASGQTPLEDTTKNIGKPVRIGNSGSTDQSLQGNAPMNGRMAYFLWTDAYTATSEAYETLYAEVVQPR